MATSSVSYEKISFNKIELGLKQVLRTIVHNTYISNKFKMVGNECVRINLLESNSIEQHTSWEEREYTVQLRYYTNAKMSDETINKNVKARIDKIKKKLIDNQHNSGGSDGASNKWISLEIPTIAFDINDEENEEDDDLYISELTLILNNTNSY